MGWWFYLSLLREGAAVFRPFSRIIIRVKIANVTK